ncbi:MAG: AI-2E family transporter, partial [Spirochaetes bacterium]|nr:AI-2E family transporter [Spirochaetota bacterium]
EIKKGFLSLIPNKYFEMSLITLSEVDNIFGNYIRGNLLESLIIAIISIVGFYIIGFPPITALVIGLINGLTNAIPYVGPLIGLVIGLAVCIFKLIPPDYVPLFGIEASIIGVIIVAIFAQVLDNIAIKPTVIGKSVNLHPLVVILGVMAGSKMFGFIGLLAAIPVIAIIKVVIITLYKQLKGFNLLSEHLISINFKKTE